MLVENIQVKIAERIPKLLVLVGLYNCAEVLATVGEFARMFLGLNFSFSRLK